MAANFGDVRLVILNAGSSRHAGLALQAAGGAVPVLQDYNILSPSIWELMGAAKDDIMVFDRCGRLTYHVIMPWSMLTYPYVKAAILSTYHDEPCGQCNVTSISHKEEDHHDEHQAHGESDQSSVNASYAEQFLLAPQMVQPTLSLTNLTTSEPLQEPVETTIMAPPTYEEDAINQEEIGTVYNPERRAEQGGSNESVTTTTEASEEHGDVEEVVDAPPLRVIMRYPHSHQDHKGVVKKHDYLVMRTGDADYHGHLEEEGVTQEGGNQAPVDTQRNAIRRDDTSHTNVFRDYPLWRHTWVNRGSGDSNSSVRVDNMVRARVGEDMQEGEVNREEVAPSQKEGAVAENGDEGDDDESQDIKQKMIEHYKKLLPWINYTL